jgi:hypothetical protein
LAAFFGSSVTFFGGRADEQVSASARTEHYTWTWSSEVKAVFTVLRGVVVVTGAVVLAACQTTQEKQPTIAHTHIGHSLTAWVTTPNEQGLYVVAEKEARALNKVVNSVNETSSLAQMKAASSDALYIIEPTKGVDGPGEGYGLLRAFDGAVLHLKFAAQSADASENFRKSVPKVEETAIAINNRIELVLTLAQEVLKANSALNARPLMKEIQTESRAIIFGAELDGKPPIGSSPEEPGLNQLRNDIAAMTARENPQYIPVAEKWLFGLIRLPSGEWKFDFSTDKAADGGGY